MYDIIVIGAGAAGASFASKRAKYAKVLLIDENYYYSIEKKKRI